MTFGRRLSKDKGPSHRPSGFSGSVSRLHTDVYTPHPRSSREGYPISLNPRTVSEGSRCHRVISSEGRVPPSPPHGPTAPTPPFYVLDSLVTPFLLIEHFSKVHYDGTKKSTLSERILDPRSVCLSPQIRWILETFCTERSVW